MIISNLSLVLGDSGSTGSDPQCDSGGPGAMSCSISTSGGINGGGLGGNGSGECSVTCSTGEYACCYIDYWWPFIHCICKNNSGSNNPE